jgi:hypothetical protein
MKKSIVKTSNLVKKRRKKFIAKIIAVVFSILAIIVSIAIISRLSYFKIDQISIAGNETIDTLDIQSSVEQAMFGNYLLLFPKNSTIFYPNGAIKKMLFSKFSRVLVSSVGLSGLHTLDIKITEKKPFATWCKTDGVEPNSAFTNNCYFMDDRGQIFSKAPEFSESVYVKYYGLINGDPIGQIYKLPFQFNDISAMIDFLNNRNLNPTLFVAKNDGSFEMRLKGDGVLYLSADLSLSKTLENLQALFDKENIASSNSTTTIDHIDLRFGNKILYKFK